MKLYLALAATLVTAACASSQELRSTETLSVVNADTLPPPTREDVSNLTRAYVLGPYDKVSVDVFGLPELSRVVQIDASGRISLPLIGSMEVSGVSANELETQVGTLLKQNHVRNPQVSVNVVEAVSQVVTVDGEVKSPGAIPAAGKLTLMRAIARAGGVTEFANMKHVVVLRSVEGKRYAALYDVRAIRQGLYSDPEVFANDVVLVGTSQARRIFRDIINSAPILSAPLIALLQ
ncbi:MAG: polysaccharide export protein [Sphingomonas sp.]|uniref:polysaccharide biosynthesis/export family protein n=1 Tax=Sphingomonas sp. TaxID=28214 RepID=UPI001B02E070|nr:polysaccharide biosynthesis/export family protein [Sphingomonas sp.]MBO9622434.1 polysaccharide export protein [Sphingomonas sp.]